MRLRDFHHHQSRLYEQEFVTTAQLTITFENGKKNGFMWIVPVAEFSIFGVFIWGLMVALVQLTQLLCVSV
jgi:hypothetical protein